MPAAPVVGGAQYGATRTRRRGEKRCLEAGRAAVGPVTPHPGSKFVVSATGGHPRKKSRTFQLRAETATRSRPALSRPCRHPPCNRHGPGKVFRADLFPWTFAERP